MIVPNKFRPLEKTVLGKIRIILKQDNSNIPISELYQNVGGDFDCIDEFLYALDVLYLLGRINVNFENGIVEYVN